MTRFGVRMKAVMIRVRAIFRVIVKMESRLSVRAHIRFMFSTWARAHARVCLALYLGLGLGFC
jgi:hypothetical protein